MPSFIILFNLFKLQYIFMLYLSLSYCRLATYFCLTIFTFGENSFGTNEWEEKYKLQQEKMEAMERQLQKLTMNKAQAMCSFCYSTDHLSTDCHMQPPRAEEANFVNAGWRRPEQQFNQGYNQNQ